MQYVLLLNKPKGWTSFDVVNFVRRRMATERGVKPLKVKVGHAGTLDPLATGLLLLAHDEGTKQIMSLMKQDKTYEVTMRLGITSATQDEEGEKTAVSDRVPTEQEVATALLHFVGDSMQIPPAFSALKVDGRRAYDLARSGKPVELQPRAIHIEYIDQVRYEYPFVYFRAHVGSGTYIRSLVRDIGERLGTGAYMSDLCRTSIGDYSLADAQTPEQWEQQNYPLKGIPETPVDKSPAR